MALEIKRLKKEAILELKQLFENTAAVLKHSPFYKHSIDVFRWSFFADGYEPSIYIVASDSEKKELIGTQAAMFIAMQTPTGEVCRTIKNEDTVVNIEALADHGRIDILKEMYAKIDEMVAPMNIKFHWGFSNPLAVRANKRLGYNCDISSKQGVYTLRIFPAYRHLVKLNELNSLKQKVQIMGLTIMSYLKTHRHASAKSELICRKITLDEVDEDTLISFLPKNLYSIYLNKYYLDWRIIKNPSTLKYSILQFSDKQENVISYLIYSLKEKSVCFIEQFLHDQQLNSEEKKILIKTALRFFRSENAAIIRVMGFEHNSVNKEEVTLFSETGFIFIKKGISFIFKRNENSENIKPENIYLSRLNTQGIY